MKLNFLPDKYTKALTGIIDNLTEIRLRVGQPVKIKINLNDYYLCESGYSKTKKSPIICEKDDIDFVIDCVTERSIYAYNDQIKQGFLTTNEGIRIGLAGECVYEKDKVVTIKDFTSLNVRIPHLVKDCSLTILNKILQNKKLENTLIFSPPMCGKTTILKDLSLNLSRQQTGEILIVDERGEFGQINGENIDVIKFGDKLFSFEYGLRAMTPTIVITDELQTKRDWALAEKAANSGVKIIASCHADTIKDLSAKRFFKKHIFNRYVLLGNGNKIGEIQKVYNGDFVQI